MQPDTTYSIVHHLERAGQWDLALDVLGDRDPNRRAELVAERAFWQGVPADLDIVNAADPSEVAFVYQDGQTPHMRMPADHYQMMDIGLFDLYVPVRA